MGEKNPLVSVIVPIYMVDQFLGHCIESIMEQSYQELEIILVDDGSRDRSPEMCDMYAQKDKRIKVEQKFLNKRVVLYSAGSFGHQAYTHLIENGHCDVAAWVDNYYVEYRRCCRNVDPVETVMHMDYDYILLAVVNAPLCEEIRKRLLDMGVREDRILSVFLPQDQKEELLDGFLNPTP